MTYPRSQSRRFVSAALFGLLFLGGAAQAQTIQVFDEAPTIEQLRSIMVPESRPSATRSIILQRPDMGAANGVQSAAARLGAPSHTASQTTAVAAKPAMPATSPPTSGKSGPAAEPGVVAFHINFGFNSTALPDSAHEMVDLIAQLMQENPGVKLRVEGHTDAVGSVNYNVELSERRALSVAEYLVHQGVDPARLILIGKGMAEPLTRNPFDAANRRVQFVRVG